MLTEEALYDETKLSWEFLESQKIYNYYCNYSSLLLCYCLSIIADVLQEKKRINNLSKTRYVMYPMKLWLIKAAYLSQELDLLLHSLYPLIERRL